VSYRSGHKEGSKKKKDVYEKSTGTAPKKGKKRGNWGRGLSGSHAGPRGSYVNGRKRELKAETPWLVTGGQQTKKTKEGKTRTKKKK